jgi:hypothetical protein
MVDIHAPDRPDILYINGLKMILNGPACYPAWQPIESGPANNDMGGGDAYDCVRFRCCPL